MDTNIHEVIESAAILDNTDDLLADLDLTPEVESDEDVLSALDPSDEAALEIAVERAEAYTDQEVTTSGVEAVEASATPAPKKARAAGAAKTPKAPRAPKDLESIDPELFVLDHTSYTASGLEANRTEVIALRPAQKKIAEKFDNLFQSLSVGKKPSVYVMACFDVLESKGEASSSDLVAALKAMSTRGGSTYSEGTARSQVGQIMNLFHTVKIATRTAHNLVLDRTSPLTVKLKALASA